MKNGESVGKEHESEKETIQWCYSGELSVHLELMTSVGFSGPEMQPYKTYFEVGRPS